MALKPVRVSQLNSYIKRILQTDPILGNVSVIGEISNLKYHSTGHVYFTLKDENSKINCFLGSDTRRFLRYELADGMEVTAAGYVSVFERGGTYSLNVRDIEVSGLGNLNAAFLRLKEKLDKEGLFDSQYKKKIPAFPKRIAVITSPTGAAVRDVIKIIRGRNDYTSVLVYPCLVQGPDAAMDIAEAIEDVNRRFSDVETIIVGRGGGSLEELWPFNEEVVARSVFLSKIPVISAVGHETDFTICDFVADDRAETPTAAAQMAVPDMYAVREFLQNQKQELFHALERVVRYLSLRVENLNKEQLTRLLLDRLRTEELKLFQLKAELDALNPVEVMERGYGVITGADGKLISSVRSLKKGDPLQVSLKDGTLECLITELKHNA